jgi:hypothetical protein
MGIGFAEAALLIGLLLGAAAALSGWLHVLAQVEFCRRLLPALEP